MSYVQYTIKHKPLLWIVMWLSGWRWGIWAEKKVPIAESNPRLKWIRKVQHHNLPNIPYECQQVISTGAIYVVFWFCTWGQPPGVQRVPGHVYILPSGGHPLHIFLQKKKRKNYAIGVLSSSQTMPANIDAHSSAHVRIFFSGIRTPPSPPTRGSGFRSRHPLASKSSLSFCTPDSAGMSALQVCAVDLPVQLLAHHAEGERSSVPLWVCDYGDFLSK